MNNAGKLDHGKKPMADHELPYERRLSAALIECSVLLGMNLSVAQLFCTMISLHHLKTPVSKNNPVQRMISITSRGCIIHAGEYRRKMRGFALRI